MPRKRKRRFVFDTNVLISAALTPEGEAWDAVEKADQTGYFLLSNETFAELREVLYRPAFDAYLTSQIRRWFIIQLLRKSLRIEITETIEACSDPDDDIFLEVAVSGKADCIVTRNVRDFPVDRFRGIPILTPEQFLEHKEL